MVVQLTVYVAVHPAGTVTDDGVTVTLWIWALSVNLYCAVRPEVAAVAVIRNFTPPSVS